MKTEETPNDRKDRIQQQADFIKMRARGVGYDTIAKELKVSKPTLIKWSRELQIQIKNYTTLELASLHEQYLTARVNRVEMLSMQLSAMRQEFAKRDLGTIPTDKLVLLMIKLNEQITIEDKALEFQSTDEGFKTLTAMSPWWAA